MPATTTLITPAENRFFLLSERSRRATTLQQISSLLHAHVTVRADSPFLKPTVRNLIVHDHADWLTACSHEWQLLASLPYVINPSEERRQWQHCELCHKPVRYEYHVQNKQNHRELVVGSECVKKFMNAETRYLMVITTEDNFYAVAQYQTLTATVPVVPTIMFKQPWLPDLPGEQRPTAQRLRQTTTQTVTTYLKRKNAALPVADLQPAERTYQQLVTSERNVLNAAKRAAEAKLDAETRQRQARATATAQAAATDLRQSRAYRHYLHRLAAIIVVGPTRLVAKAHFDQLTAPKTTKPLVNSYQFGQMVTEYQRSGHIQVKRLAMLDRQFVTDLDQVTRQLDDQQTVRFYDDVFNSCWGWQYPQAAFQRADWQRLLTTRWAGDLSLAWFEQLATQTTVTAIQTWLTTHASAAMRQALTQRLTTQPDLQAIPRERLTKSELRTFCERMLAASPTVATFQREFDTQYQLLADRQAEMHETLAYYFIAQHSTGDHQSALKRLQWLLAQP
ncbi:hypothetical protein [Lactiplantibacillus carotarum]|uniref:hypothetical protein n=1 Tax=Lactiplantibacillus carotarum TaxID=2993456 RepID=UPI00298F0E52|nr:hypothetical protein [Lactiplantibacillus carotarum]